VSKIKIANIRGPKGDPGDTTAANALAAQAAQSASTAEAFATQIASATGNALESAGVAHAEAVIATQMRDQAAGFVTDAQEIVDEAASDVVAASSANLTAAQSVLGNTISARDDALSARNAAGIFASDASASASTALASKNAAASSETNANASKVNAAASEAAALVSKNAAAGSASAASTSAADALASKNAASTSASTATTKAGEASASAAAALVSKNAAGVSEGNAAGSAAAAAATLAGAVPKSLIDAKGDILVGSADNTPARLPAAANGSVLVTDSAQASGLRYEGPTVFPRTTAQTLSTAEKTQALANLGVTPGTTPGAMAYVSDAIGSIKTQPVVPFLKNLLTNSDFSNGTTGWSGNSGTLAATGGIGTVTGTAGTFSIFQQTVSLVAGRVYYLNVRARVNQAGCSSISTYSGSGSPVYMVTSPASGAWNTATAQFTATAAYATINIYQYYGSAAANLGATMDVDYATLIDLTAAFGAGFEPSKDEMDKLMAQWGGWFADTDPKLLPSYVWAKRTQGALSNVISNGDMSSGTSGWTVGNASMSAASNVLTVTANGGASAYIALTNVSGLLRQGRRYYVSCLVRATGSVTPYTITLQGAGSTGVTLTSPVIGTWYLLSNANAGLNDGFSANWYMALAYPSIAEATGATIEVKWANMLDLTAAFGAGNEPTKSEMDLLLSKYPNSWFNGTVNDLVKDFDKWNRRGTGSPEGVVTASPGVKWTDTANTNGAKEWRKDTGTGNTGWIVTVGDTGWRTITSWDTAGVVTGTALPASTEPLAGVAGFIKWNRTTDRVSLWIRGLSFTATADVVFTAPSGFRPYPLGVAFRRPIILDGGAMNSQLKVNSSIYIAGLTGKMIDGTYGLLEEFAGKDAWPTTLPGVAV